MNLFYLLHSRCIKWAQEAFPAGGDSSGLVVIYEQCVRTFWHSERYKDDLRYLKVWLEYVGFFLLFTCCNSLCVSEHAFSKYLLPL